MPVDHSQATATITFSGLALFRLITQANTRQCEAGILICKNHKLGLLIEEITLEADRITPQSSRVIQPEFDLGKDIFIKVNSPMNAGVTAYKRDLPGERPFSKDAANDDTEDFRWVVDFESADFNGGKITPIPDKFNPKIFISDGTLYAAAITPDYFARELLTDLNDRRFIGQVAFRVGVDIGCADGAYSGIELSNQGGPSQFLPKKAGVKYVISIENICPLTTETMAEGSDFRFYYDAITTLNGKKFDLRRVVRNGGLGDVEKRLRDRLNFSVDSFPQICNPGQAGG